MAQLPEVFNAAEADDLGFKAIPPSWQASQIIKADLADTKDRTGKMIKLTFKIIEGEFAKRLIFNNLNIINKSETAVNIARAHLKGICEALDIESVVDTEELLGQPLQIKLDIEPAANGYPEKNKIVAYRNINEDIEDNSNNDESDSDDDIPF